MKAILTIAVMSIIAVNAGPKFALGQVTPGKPMAAKEETLVKGGMEFGWFVGPMARLTLLDGDVGFISGVRAGLVINHNLMVGGSLAELQNTNVSKRTLGPGETARMTFSYGGFIAEYDFAPRRLTHTSVAALIGYGETNYEFKGPDYKYIDDALTDGFFVLEPEVDFTVNISHFAHFGMGASYRFVSGVERHGLSNGDIAGPAISATLKLGSF